jgi:hypothetical protein
MAVGPDGYLITNGHVAQLANTKDEDALLEQKKLILEQCLAKKTHAPSTPESGYLYDFTD